MPETHFLIQTITVGAGGASTIEFTSIPQTYTDLCLKLSNRQSGTGGSANVWDNYFMSFNGSSANKRSRDLHGYDASANNNYYSDQFYFWGNIDGSTANTFTNTEIYIPNYSSTTVTKSYYADSVAEHNGASNYMMFLQAGLWSDTSAITSIRFNTTVGNTRTFMQHSSASLYGIKNS